MKITFTAGEARFSYDLIRHRPNDEVGKIANELKEKVIDSLDNEDEVELNITPSSLLLIYLLINNQEGHVAPVSYAMKTKLTAQMQTALSEQPVMEYQLVDDPDFVQPDPDNPIAVPQITVQISKYSTEYYEWLQCYQLVTFTQSVLDKKLEDMKVSGKDCLNKLR